MRAIDADELEPDADYYDGDCWAVSMSQIQDAPTIEPRCEACEAFNKTRLLIPQPEPQWIPVTKRLPNREEYIRCNGLFIVSDGDRTYAEYFDIYDKKCFGEPVMHGFRADRAVTAWMPLPEPYRKRMVNGD